MVETPETMFRYRRITTINFNDTIPATTHRTLVSDVISFPFEVIEALLIFDDDHGNSVRIYLLHSQNTTISTVSPPPDFYLNPIRGNVPYFVGNGVIYNVKCNYRALTTKNYIKVHAHNINAYAVTINVLITIVEL